MACASPLAEPARSHEVRKSVTVVFCDVTGSTALGELLDPEALRRVMTRYFDTMKVAIERHGGTVEKFIGDAVMAVFGIPQVHEDDALRAVRAAVEMRDGLVDLNKQLERDHGVTLALADRREHGRGRRGRSRDRAGARDRRRRQHRGPSRAGGGSGRDPDRRGDVPARRATRSAAEPAEPIAPRARRSRSPAYRLGDVTAGVAGHTRRLDAPMVGRDRELALLGQAFERRDDRSRLPPLHGPRDGRCRQDEARGRVRRSGRCRRDRPARAMPRLRGGHHVLAGRRARGSGARALDPRRPEDAQTETARRDRAGTSARSVIADLVACLVGLSETQAPVEESFWALRRFLEILAARSAPPAAPRRSPVGRADVPRSRRARGRMVPRRPDPGRRAGAARAP